MKDLEKLTIKRIYLLAGLIENISTSYSLAKEWTKESCQNKDAENMEKWHKNRIAIEEIKELSNALLEYGK